MLMIDGHHRSHDLGHYRRFKTRADTPDVFTSSGIGRILVVVERFGYWHGEHRRSGDAMHICGGLAYDVAGDPES